MIQQHTIKKFSFELQLQGIENNYALQRKCIGMVNEQFIDEMDGVLSAGFPGDEITRINTIEIDLGNIAPGELEKNFTERYMAALTAAIKSLPLHSKTTMSTEIAVLSKEENFIEQFLYFLSSGKMRWATRNTNFKEWQWAVEASIHLKPVFFKQRFSDLLQTQHDVVERLSLQFDDAFITTLVELYHPHAKTAYEHLLQVIHEKLLPAFGAAIKKQVLQKLLPVLFNYRKRTGKTELQQIFELLFSAYLKTMDEPSLLLLKEAVVAVLEKTIHPGNAALYNGAISADPAAVHTVTETREQQKSEVEKEEVADNTVYINNAGIIILHPFLKNIFTATGLMQEEQFTSDLSKQKAVHLLQYLANRERETPEYIMPLHKILCGLSNEEHIDRFITLEPADITEADALLDAVVAHWDALKNTSATAMQETFFQRNGKLSFNEMAGYWKLQVERKAVDILLDKIPWGISYIQLPWMKQALVTEW